MHHPKFSNPDRLPPPFLSFVGSASGAHHDLPTRDDSHPITLSYGSRPPRRNLFCSTLFLAKAVACSGVCRLSFESAIHWRMIFRRVSWSSMSADCLFVDSQHHERGAATRAQ